MIQINTERVSRSKHIRRCDTNMRSCNAKVRKCVLLDRKLVIKYTSSLIRLMIFVSHCGPNHPCTITEIQLLKRYDSSIIGRHTELNNNCEYLEIMEALIACMIEVSKNVIQTLDLEPEFANEILIDFAKMIKNRFLTM